MHCTHNAHRTHAHCTLHAHRTHMHMTCDMHMHMSHVHEPAPGAPRGAAAGRRDDLGTRDGTGHAVRGGPDGMPTARAPARRLQPCALEAATLCIRGPINPAPPCSRRHRLGQGHYLSLLVSPTISRHLPPSPSPTVQGGIASGKSTVARHLREALGATCLDCDQLAHEVRIYMPSYICICIRPIITACAPLAHCVHCVHSA